MVYEIVAVRKYSDGSIESVKLNNGNVLSYDRAIQAAKEGFISNVSVDLDESGKDYLVPNASSNIPNKLEYFPIF